MTHPARPVAAFLEVYRRAFNPARPAMLWDAGVRGAPALFAAFRARMAQLLREVCCSGLLKDQDKGMLGYGNK